jgi:hypothetical protein
MTYTINGKEWTEFEINKRCAELLAWESEPNVKGVEFDGNCFWVKHVGFSAFPVQDYCINPVEAWLIIDKCLDDLLEYVGFDGTADTNYDGASCARWRYLMQKHNCTKLVAACICFIEINEGKL